MKIIYNFIDKINYNLGLLLFKNSNLFSLNLYKYFYKKNICNLNLLSNGFINSYYQNGYSKLGSASPNHIEELKHLLSLQKPTINEEYLFHYKITPEIYEIIKKILNLYIKNVDKFFKKTIKILIKNFYNIKKYNINHLNNIKISKFNKFLKKIYNKFYKQIQFKAKNK